MPKADEPQYLSPLDAARALGISVAALHRWAQADRLESVLTAGGERLYPREVIDRLARETGRNPLEPNGGDC